LLAWFVSFFNVATDACELVAILMPTVGLTNHLIPWHFFLVPPHETLSY
jgi:hypothetical protein